MYKININLIKIIYLLILVLFNYKHNCEKLTALILNSINCCTLNINIWREKEDSSKMKIIQINCMTKALNKH